MCQQTRWKVLSVKKSNWTMYVYMVLMFQELKAKLVWLSCLIHKERLVVVVVKNKLRSFVICYIIILCIGGNDGYMFFRAGRSIAATPAFAAVLFPVKIRFFEIKKIKTLLLWGFKNFFRFLPHSFLTASAGPVFISSIYRTFKGELIGKCFNILGGLKCIQNVLL